MQSDNERIRDFKNDDQFGIKELRRLINPMKLYHSFVLLGDFQF